ARGEPVRGQIAVAQVVMNRVFSGYYPDNVCGVVYQNANRRFACQFTFACDGRRDRVDEPDAWRRAKEIARDTLDGKLWLPDVGKATHYHAYWVRPVWIREMHKLDRIGVHTFYRPRNWGDGADAPVWGDAATTKEEVEKL
ncbi:MAG: cell wall hydrolase, partial [Acetobacteraceae bacterium]|nr:cell wall hydrolase [Acetobacteraceae bacterium]